MIRFVFFALFFAFFVTFSSVSDAQLDLLDGYKDEFLDFDEGAGAEIISEHLGPKAANYIYEDPHIQNLYHLYWGIGLYKGDDNEACLLYTSPSPRDRTRSRMPSSA